MRVLMYPGFLPDTWSSIEERYVWLDKPIDSLGGCYWLVPPAGSRIERVAKDAERSRSPIYVAKLQEAGAKLIERKLSRYNVASNLLMLAKVFREFQIDVVYTHFGPLRFHVEAAARLCGIRVARGEHNLAFHPDRRFRTLKRVFWRWTTAFFIPVSRAVAAHLRESKVMQDNFKVVHDGFDLDRYPTPDSHASRESLCKELKLESGTRFLVCVAKIHPAKRQHLLIDALKEVPDSTVVLLLVGGIADQSYADEILARARVSGLQERVLTLGYRSDVPRILDASEVSYLPSVVEGLGNVIIESGLMATPAIASDLPAIREIIEDSVDGYLVAGADPREYARLTNELLGSEALRTKLGGAARMKMRKLFSREVFIRDTLQALEECFHSDGH